MIYAVSNEGPGPLEKMRSIERLGKAFVFLSDPKGILASLYGGVYDKGPLKGVLKPATVVVGRGGKIVFGEADEDYKVRPAALAVLKAAQSAMTKK